MHTQQSPFHENFHLLIQEQIPNQCCVHSSSKDNVKKVLNVNSPMILILAEKARNEICTKMTRKKVCYMLGKIN